MRRSRVCFFALFHGHFLIVLPLDSGLNDELEHLRFENAKLKEEKSEQAERLVAFEKTIKSKTAETKQVF